MSIFTELSGGPPSTVGRGARTNASRKYAGLLLRTPAVFAAVAPGVRRFYDVAYSDGVAELAPMLTVPNRLTYSPEVRIQRGPSAVRPGVVSSQRDSLPRKRANLPRDTGG